MLQARNFLVLSLTVFAMVNVVTGCHGSMPTGGIIHAIVRPIETETSSEDDAAPSDEIVASRTNSASNAETSSEDDENNFDDLAESQSSSETTDGDDDTENNDNLEEDGQNSQSINIRLRSGQRSVVNTTSKISSTTSDGTTVSVTTTTGQQKQFETDRTTTSSLVVRIQMIKQRQLSTTSTSARPQPCEPDMSTTTTTTTTTTTKDPCATRTTPQMVTTGVPSAIPDPWEKIYKKFDRKKKPSRRNPWFSKQMAETSPMSATERLKQNDNSRLIISDCNQHNNDATFKSPKQWWYKRRIEQTFNETLNQPWSEVLLDAKRIDACSSKVECGLGECASVQTPGERAMRAVCHSQCLMVGCTGTVVQCEIADETTFNCHCDRVVGYQGCESIQVSLTPNGLLDLLHGWEKHCPAIQERD